uniref:Uncharacterized protein n=1 Tax=Rhizophora mucronata TaxID=61149 RepID=A0A2P2NZ05_RHIMU
MMFLWIFVGVLSTGAVTVFGVDSLKQES